MEPTFTDPSIRVTLGSPNSTASLPVSEFYPVCHTRRSLLDIAVVAPEARRDDTISIRVESTIRLDLTIRPDAPFSWDFIKIPRTASVRNAGALALQKYVNFSLELRGATSDEVCRVVCRRCRRRKTQRGTEIVDFDSPTDLVEIVGGRARICFRLKCYSQHNRLVDDEYMYAAGRTPALHLSNPV